MTAIYSDIDIKLTKQLDGDIQKDEDIQAIFNSLENICMTIQGQRRMRPDFAYGPHNFLFEAINADNARSLGEILLQAIATYEGRAEVTNIHVTYDSPGNLYNVTVSFSMVGMPAVVYNIDFILKRL
jgi:phage baseplate assembly protein W